MDNPPCALCGSVTNERANIFTGGEWYCIDDVACQSRRMKQEQERAAIEAAQENKDDGIKND